MRKQLITLTLLVFFVLPITAGLYLNSKTYPEKELDASSLISNSYVLKENLPEQVYAYTLTRIARFQSVESPDVDYYTINDSGLTRLSGSYGLTLVPSDGSKPLYIAIEVKNYGNFFAITVKINGEVQNIS